MDQIRPEHLVGGRRQRGRVYEGSRALALAVVGPIQFSRGSGHWRSALTRASVGPGGAAIPWYSYPLVDLLDQRHFAGRRVLEFGCGASTRWWAERADEVVAIEPDEGWFRALRSTVPGNVDLRHVPVREDRDISGVTEVLDEVGGAFDVVVVDGHLREECAQAAWPRVSDDGALIFDNSENYGFADISRVLGGSRADFYGFSSGSARKQCTSVVFDGRCFLFDPAAPIRPVG